MDNLKNAFTILYLLSCSDGEVCASELDLIMKYLQDNKDKIEFDHRQITGPLLFLSAEENKLKVEVAAQDYKNNSSEEERNDLLKFAFKLVISDGKIDTEEIRMFNILGKIWNIDIDEFIKVNHLY
jgi:tellurite resistance protein